MTDSRSIAIACGWRDVGARERNRVRGAIQRGERKPLAKAGEGATMTELFADAARVPEEYFICGACGTGPWHVSWGGLCGNCTGAD